MPISMIDPSVAPVGAGIPNSPLAGMFGQAVAAYGNTFPTAAERARMQLEQAQTQAQQQQTAGAGALGGVFRDALSAASQAVPNGPPVERPRPPVGDVGNIGPQPVVQPTRQPTNAEIMSSHIAQVADALSRGGQIGQLGPVARTMAGYLPNQNAQGMTLPQLAAGEGYPSTAEYAAGGTPEVRTKNMEVNQTVAMHDPASGHSPAEIRAFDAVHNIERPGVNPATGQPYTINLMNLPQQSNASGSSSAPQTPTGTENHNPFNLRPVGATTGFQSFPTEQAGVIAGMHDLALKLSGKSQAMGGKFPTLNNIISTYSPPNENNTQALIQAAAKRMNIDPNAPLDISYLQPLSEAILTQEGNGGSTTKPSSAMTQLRAGPGDFVGDTSQGYGGQGVMSSVGSQLGAVTNAGSTDNAKLASDQMSQFKKAMLDLERARTGGKQNASGNSLITDTLPPTGAIDSLEDVWKRATTGAGTASSEGVNALNDVLDKRAQDQAIINDQRNQPADLVKNSYAGIKFEDSIIQRFGSDALKAEYNKQYGGLNLTPPAASNLDKAKALTTPQAYKSIADVVAAVKAGKLSRTEGKAISRSQFGDN